MKAERNFLNYIVGIFREECVSLKNELAVRNVIDISSDDDVPSDDDDE